MSNAKILIVEDEHAISDLIALNLSLEGFNCSCAYDGKEAADMLEANTFDLALLDIMLPKIDGYELLDYAKFLNIPVIFLTAKSLLNDRLKGLNLGAEDYIVKPFEISELIARVNVVLRRYNKAEAVLTFGDYKIDVTKRTVLYKNDPVRLTTKEFDLFVYLVQNKGQIIPKETLYERIWEDEYNDESRTLELHVQRLRKKAMLSDKLNTVYGYGYRLDN